MRVTRPVHSAGLSHTVRWVTYQPAAPRDAANACLLLRKQRAELTCMVAVETG